MPRKKVEKAKQKVLIESDWNLKTCCNAHFHTGTNVLIESDWNLKERTLAILSGTITVLIESDWNLKHTKKKRETKPSQY